MAHRTLVICSANGVRSTRRGYTRISGWWGFFLLLFCRYFEATLERISCCAWWTTTDGTVIDHLTASLNAAGTGAGIHALAIDTGLQGRALAGNDTFGATLWWGSNEAFQARAHSMSVDITALTVRTTWRGGTSPDFGYGFDNLDTAAGERITLVSLLA